MVFEFVKEEETVSNDVPDDVNDSQELMVEDIVRVGGVGVGITDVVPTLLLIDVLLNLLLALAEDEGELDEEAVAVAEEVIEKVTGGTSQTRSVIG
jgi:hypothetical protein